MGFKEQQLISLFVHCLHGLGHGSMVVSAFVGMQEKERRAYDEQLLCDQIQRGTTEIAITPAMLKSALNICRSGPTLQFQYICQGACSWSSGSLSRPLKRRIDPQSLT